MALGSPQLCKGSLVIEMVRGRGWFDHCNMGVVGVVPVVRSRSSTEEDVVTAVHVQSEMNYDCSQSKTLGKLLAVHEELDSVSRRDRRFVVDFAVTATVDVDQ